MAGLSKSKFSSKKLKEPKTVKERGGIGQIYRVLPKEYSHPLIVVSPSLVKMNLHVKLLEALQRYNIKFSAFTHVFSNPTLQLVDEAHNVYKTDGCDSLIGFGGSSAIDIAKMVGVYVSNPKYKDKPPRGYVNIGNNYPYLIAIPTTAGTGSESSAEAVMTNKTDHDKYVVANPKLMPRAVIMDSSIVASLPKTTIATSGMDLITHCIEAYLGKNADRKVKSNCLDALRIVKESFMEFFANPGTDRLAVRMQEASFKVGIAKSTGLYGYVHALSHSISGFYNAPHGYANAVLLPPVLEAYGKVITPKLAEISDGLRLISTTKTKDEKAAAVIAWLKEFNMKLGIGNKFSGFIRNNDVSPMITHAQKEIGQGCPIPKKLNTKTLQRIFTQVR